MSSRIWGPGESASGEADALSGEERAASGVLSSAGRGTVGTDALPGRMSLALWVLAAGYLAVAGLLVWLAVALAPWGLLFLVLAAGAVVVALLVAFIAYGVANLEEDDEA